MPSICPLNVPASLLALAHARHPTPFRIRRLYCQATPLSICVCIFLSSCFFAAPPEYRLRITAALLLAAKQGSGLSCSSMPSTHHPKPLTLKSNRVCRCVSCRARCGAAAAQRRRRYTQRAAPPAAAPWTRCVSWCGLAFLGTLENKMIWVSQSHSSQDAWSSLACTYTLPRYLHTHSSQRQNRSAHA